MAEQSEQPKNNVFMRAFLPGLAVGVVVGALGWAFVGPMISNEPPPVKPVKTGEIPPGAIPAPPPELMTFPSTMIRPCERPSLSFAAVWAFRL